MRWLPRRQTGSTISGRQGRSQVTANHPNTPHGHATHYRLSDNVSPEDGVGGGGVGGKGQWLHSSFPAQSTNNCSTTRLGLQSGCTPKHMNIPQYIVPNDGWHSGEVRGTCGSWTGATAHCWATLCDFGDDASIHFEHSSPVGGGCSGVVCGATSCIRAVVAAACARKLRGSCPGLGAVCSKAKGRDVLRGE
jgi:hypothetical protein